MGCLDHLFQATLPPSATIDIFLVDDGSPDLLGRNVKEKYPQVNVINGNSALFWSGGMHKAWEESIKTKEFQYFLWLNDDTIFIPKRSLNCSAMILYWNRNL